LSIVHRAGDVDDEGERHVLAFVDRHVVALDADAQHPVGPAFSKRERRAVNGNPEARPGFWVWVLIVKVVDELLGAHRVFGWQPALLHVAARYSVGAAVNIHGEGGEIVLSCGDKAAHAVILEEHVGKFVEIGGSGRLQCGGFGVRCRRGRCNVRARAAPTEDKGSGKGKSSDLGERRLAFHDALSCWCERKSVLCLARPQHDRTAVHHKRQMCISGCAGEDVTLNGTEAIPCMFTCRIRYHSRRAA
jgi:hypothetical protein